jgi:hypothetical protein
LCGDRDKCGGVFMTLTGWLLSGAVIGLIAGWIIANKIKAYIKKENEEWNNIANKE